MNELKIEGFKCFKTVQNFNLKQITVLTGSNGSGKSSVIQSLLLLRSAIERNTDLGSDLYFDCSKWKNIAVPLNSLYELKLGTYNDIFNDNNDFRGDKIKIIFDHNNFEIPMPSNLAGTDEISKDHVPFHKANKDESMSNGFLNKREFYYLNAERIGPRFSMPVNFIDFVHCGFKGEYTAQVLLQDPHISKVAKQRRNIKNDSDNLRIQTDNWLQEICPGTFVIPQYLDALTSQLRVKNNSSKSDLLATNIGFGISYSLPIIVTGLIAKKGSVIIIENPEAHLHPKGQSNMGYFLSKIAASGVKIIIETHSEHIINGIRRGLFSDFGIKPTNTSLYFFNGFNDKNKELVSPILLKDNGDLSPFPRNFFDQVQQDMAEMYRLTKGQNHG